MNGEKIKKLLELIYKMEDIALELEKVREEQKECQCPR